MPCGFMILDALRKYDAGQQYPQGEASMCKLFALEAVGRSR